MKKKVAALLVGVMATAMVLTGCKLNQISNEYVEISGYKGVEIDKVEEPQEITDEYVDYYIQTILQQNGVSEEVTDRAAQIGDTVIIDYVGKMDGEEFQGGTDSGMQLELGSNRFIEGFEDSIVGHNIGETFDWNGKFPENYTNAPEKSGKDVTFTITVNDIQLITIPELNDEFVKTVSEKSKTVDEYKKEVKQELEESAKLNYEYQIQDAAWNAVLEKAKIKKYPEKELKEISKNTRKQYEDTAEYYQQSLEEFLQQQFQMSLETFEKSLKSNSKKELKEKLIIDAIADNEHIKFSDKELEKEYEEMAKLYGYEDVKTMKKIVGEDALKDQVIITKVKDLIKAEAVQVKK